MSNKKCSAEQALKLNAIIMDTAIRGKCEYRLDPICMYYKIIDMYLFVYVEGYDNNTSSYRIFKCSEAPNYEGSLLYPDYSDEHCVCLYDSLETESNSRVVLHYHESAWYDNLALLLRMRDE